MQRTVLLLLSLSVTSTSKIQMHLSIISHGVFLSTQHCFQAPFEHRQPSTHCLSLTLIISQHRVPIKPHLEDFYLLKVPGWRWAGGNGRTSSVVTGEAGSGQQVGHGVGVSGLCACVLERKGFSFWNLWSLLILGCCIICWELQFRKGNWDLRGKTKDLT